MTTNSDGALPNPGENQADPAVVDAAAAAAAQAEPAEIDIDEQAVIDATKAAEAEEAAAAAASGTPVEPGKETPATTKAGEQQQDQNAGDPVMIPKARFDEVNNRASKAETDAAYWRGVAEARGQVAPSKDGTKPAPQQQQTPTPEARLTAIQTQQDVLAKKFDDGEITYSDLVKQTRELTNQEQAIREEVLIAKVKPAATAKTAEGNDLYLDTVTAQLEDEHPWVQVFEAVGTKTQWDSLRNEAFDNLIEREIDPTTPTGKYELRKEVATLMDQRGPSMLTEKAKANGIAIPGPQTPAAQQQQGADGKPVVPAARTPLAQVRAAKLDLQERAPPNVTQMGGASVNGVGLTDAQIEAMGEDQYDALPEATRNSLLGITG